MTGTMEFKKKRRRKTHILNAAMKRRNLDVLNFIRRFSHGTCSYIRMYISAVADSVMLCLQHGFRNTIFKIKQKLYIFITSGLCLSPL
jgi:hypothetical protein